ncbi:hypothetical protein PPERSA_04053 [Pseudocohnilembus persalinus]|uniref:Uncharacterized protein n=1 Tax=Pseudocohnilembus persalinus TaxID=266149 RepID=A0A0V0QKV9_PSEPJ|nr:hypothetical protein PPERSA_04053 [Pseudocohnilembus persalinus]|eukprot:KRX02850.1 hypothetical protein PPERSA_04053 [Pseudocohnilembus persalinus]
MLLTVKNFQIDNNSDYQTATPVLITPTQKEKLQKKNQLNFLDFNLNWNYTASQIYMINFLRAKILSFTMKLEEEYVKNLASVIQNIMNLLDEDNKIKLGIISNTFNTANYLFSSQERKI